MCSEKMSHDDLLVAMYKTIASRRDLITDALWKLNGRSIPEGPKQACLDIMALTMVIHGIMNVFDFDRAQVARDVGNVVADPASSKAVQVRWCILATAR
jgi:hypothetical protein